jgi:hypothetical protein
MPDAEMPAIQMCTKGSMTEPLRTPERVSFGAQFPGVCKFAVDVSTQFPELTDLNKGAWFILNLMSQIW